MRSSLLLWCSVKSQVEHSNQNAPNNEGKAKEDTNAARAIEQKQQTGYKEQKTGIGQDQSGQDKSRLEWDRTEQNKKRTRHQNTRKDNMILGTDDWHSAGQVGTGHFKTRQGQDRTEQEDDRTSRCKRTGFARTELNRFGQDRTGQDLTKQNEAKLRRQGPEPRPRPRIGTRPSSRPRPRPYRRQGENHKVNQNNTTTAKTNIGPENTTTTLHARVGLTSKSRKL